MAFVLQITMLHYLMKCSSFLNYCVTHKLSSCFFLPLMVRSVERLAHQAGTQVHGDTIIQPFSNTCKHVKASITCPELYPCGGASCCVTYICYINILHKNYTYVIRKRNLTTSLLFQKFHYYNCIHIYKF
jgi:hypothetical protein